MVTGLETGVKTLMSGTGAVTGLIGSGITGLVSGLSGSGLFGSGAGYLWETNSPAYTVYEMSGAWGETWQTGEYTYTLFNPSTFRFESSAATEDSWGVFSMPKDDPNSYNINYRKGPDFTGPYEKVVSYLNSIGEMPAVMLNPSQFSRARAVSNEPGWVGLRRKRVGVLTGLFSEDSINENFFGTLDVSTGESRDVSFINLSGETETSRLELNDIGEEWAWTNSSGTSIYKYAGSGYNKLRQATLELELKGLAGEIVTGASGTGAAPKPNIGSVVGVSGNKQITFQYGFSPTYFNQEVVGPFDSGNNFDAVSLNLYTGRSLGFVASESTLAQTYSVTEDNLALTGYQTEITYSPPIDNVVPPGFYKILPFDFIGSGNVANVNQIIATASGTDPNTPITVAADDQLTVVNLDASSTLGNNYVNVNFPFHHSKVPVVTHSLLYTGTIDSPVGYLGAMLSGQPTPSGVTFILTDVPPNTGYALYVRSASFTN